MLHLGSIHSPGLLAEVLETAYFGLQLWSYSTVATVPIRVYETPCLTLTNKRCLWGWLTSSTEALNSLNVSQEHVGVKTLWHSLWSVGVREPDQYWLTDECSQMSLFLRLLWWWMSISSYLGNPSHYICSSFFPVSSPPPLITAPQQQPALLNKMLAHTLLSQALISRELNLG